MKVVNMEETGTDRTGSGWKSG